ncbi:Rgp1-domain-containing protein [Geopyxis carbonaria]|nr:Rgp1-domain-containing protein [Geopyxis carbonaria]
MADIRVFVTFPESNVIFAGEVMQCKITFKNVSTALSSSRGPSQLSSPLANGHSFGVNGSTIGERRGSFVPRQSPIADSKRSERVSPRAPPSRPPSAHKPSLSMMSVASANSPISPVPTGRLGHKHKRSVSIVSLGSEAGIELGHGVGRGGSQGDVGLKPLPSPSRSRGHGRSASLQIHPRRQSAVSVPSLASSRTTQPPTPLIVESETINNFSFPGQKQNPPVSKTRDTRSQSINGTFRFPSARATAPDSPNIENQTHLQSLSVDVGNTHQLNKKASNIYLRSPADEVDYDQISPGRLIPAHSINSETPRSSGEFYSLANSTTETLVSEYDPRIPPRLTRPTHNRRHSLLSLGTRSTESLMMGYAQVMGSFTMDGSLIQSNIFEDVKRKGVVGTQMGGGVVGIDTSKSDGGFLSGFGWGGLSGLLGGNNMSSIAQMKSIASTNSVPILSTPQSILFVDLRLAPGESRSYIYKFSLPKGLPPSHKGKAIKISYNMVIGTQRSGKGVQQPKVIEVPFRVFPNVDEYGALCNYDLMSPVVLLRDEATTSCIEDQGTRANLEPKKTKQESSSDDFLSYVDDLLAQRDDPSSSSLGILSPSLNHTSFKRHSIYEEQATNSKESIEMAILGVTGSPSNSIFNIARNRMCVATVTLGRPAYKLGESITAVIDFSDSQIPCYHINASLESAEEVEPSFALRSASSIHRATRKIHAQRSESTLFAKRLVFTPTIPSSATPGFSTSGFSTRWVLRLEFITTAISDRLSSGNHKDEGIFDDLLEQTYADDRGELYEPRQGIFMESFDASIPVKVYPNGADPGIGGGGVMGTHSSTAVTNGYSV